MTERGAFLDRDGTIVPDTGFLRDPTAVRLIDGAAEGIRLLREAGFRVVVVTNQSGIDRHGRSLRSLPYKAYSTPQLSQELSARSARAAVNQARA